MLWVVSLLVPVRGYQLSDCKTGSKNLILFRGCNCCGWCLCWFQCANCKTGSKKSYNFQRMQLLWVVSLLVPVRGYQLSAGLATQPFLMPSGAQYRYSITVLIRFLPHNDFKTITSHTSTVKKFMSFSDLDNV